MAAGQLAELLRAERPEAGELEAKALAAGKNSIAPWVFATRAGTPPRPHQVAKTFKKVLKAARGAA